MNRSPAAFHLLRATLRGLLVLVPLASTALAQASRKSTEDFVMVPPGATSTTAIEVPPHGSSASAHSTVERTQQRPGLQRFPLALDANASCAASWVSTFGGLPGLSGPSRTAILFDDGSGTALYVGGDFMSAGGIAARGIAKWDGQNWSALGTGLGDSFSVRALAVFDDGTGPALFAGGSFSAAGGQPAQNVARWDGTNWTPLGSGTNGPVSAMIAHDDGSGMALLVSGNFDVAGGVTAWEIARWDGTNWSVVSPFPNGVLEITSFAVFNNGSGPELFASGRFALRLDFQIAKWDGSIWTGFAKNLEGANSLAVWDDGTGESLYVGGDLFTETFGAPGNYVAKWDGTTWSALGAGTNGGVNSIAVLDDGSGPALFAAGEFTNAGGIPANRVARWDGTAWSALGAGLGVQSPSSSIAHSGLGLTGWDDGGGSKAYVLGSFGTADGVAAPNIAAWDGGGFTPVGPAGVSELVEDLITFDDGSGDALYAGGGFRSAGGTGVDFVGRWSGSGWSPLGAGVSDDVLSLAIFDDGGGEAIFAGGRFLSAGGLPANRIAKWDGIDWTALGSGLDGDVKTLAVFDDGSGSALYAGGDFTIAGTGVANYVAKWDGSAWSPLGVGVDQTVSELVVFDDGSGARLYAAGAFNFAGGIATGPIAKWNGTAWSSLGSGLVGTLSALTGIESGPTAGLYAGGTLVLGGIGVFVGVMKWDGATWSPLPGVNGSGAIRELAAHNDGSGHALYAGGFFADMGGISSNGIARWDGSTWTSMGDGMPQGWLNAFASSYDAAGPALYAGGAFGSSDGGDSNLAKWGCPAPPSIANYCTSGTSAAGCHALLGATGIASATTSSGFDLTATGVEGSKDGLFFFAANGRQANPWGNGTSFQCVLPPVRRTPLLAGNGAPGTCDGVFSRDLNALWCPTCPKPGHNPGSGVLVQAQLWYRDPLNTSNQTTSLSDAVEFVVEP